MKTATLSDLLSSFSPNGNNHLKGRQREKARGGTWTSGITAKRAATLSDDFSHSLHSKLWAGISPYLVGKKIQKISILTRISNKLK